MKWKKHKEASVQYILCYKLESNLDACFQHHCVKTIITIIFITIIFNIIVLKQYNALCALYSQTLLTVLGTTVI